MRSNLMATASSRKKVFTRNGLDWTKRFFVIVGALDIPGEGIMMGKWSSPTKAAPVFPHCKRSWRHRCNQLLRFALNCTQRRAHRPDGIPLIMSSGGNSGSQATSLLIRALALRELEIKDWWRVALREIPNGLALGAMLGLVGIVRISVWQYLGFYDYGEHWMLIALTVGATLVGIVMFGSLTGSMLPFILQRTGFDPASASAPFVATLVDVTGLVIYFTVASMILQGTLL